MKICIFGNSHAAALKHGWDLIAADHPDVTIHIYSMIGQNLSDLELEGRKLVQAGRINMRLRRYPEEAGEEVDLDLYDGFILHGLGFLPNVRAMEAPGLSSAVCEAMIADSVESTALWKLLCDIRKVSQVPVRVGHAPLRAAEEVETRGAADGYRMAIETAQQICFDGMQAVLVAQPEETIVNGDGTDPQFNMDVVPLTKDAAEIAGRDERHHDRVHMNPAFGALMLGQYLRSF